MISYRAFTICCYVSFVIGCTFTSCYSPRYVYSPPTQNIPALMKKGDMQFGGYFATGGGSSKNRHPGSTNYNLGMDLHGNIALTDHLALIVNKYNRWEKNNDGNDFNFSDSARVQYKRELTEAGGGYFAPLRKNSKNSFWQVFGGFAYGKFQIEDNGVNNAINYNRYHLAYITKIFIQPGIIIGRQNIKAAISSRFSEVFYHKITTSYTKEELDRYLLSGLSSSPVFFWEPALNYSIAFKKARGISVSLQSGFSILMNRRFVDYRTINIALGIIAGKDLFKSSRKSQ